MATFSKNCNIPKGLSALRAFNSLAKPNTINLGLGKPYIDMPKSLRVLAAKVLGDEKLRLDYSENAGFASTRAALESHYELPAGSTTLTHGAQEGLFAAVLANLEAGDEILLPNPGFLAYESMAKILKLKVRFYELSPSGTEFHYDISKILKACTKKTKMVLVCSPGNPTGSICNDIEKLAKELNRRKIWLLSDEVYGELIYDGKYAPAALLGKNIISVNAFSKSHALTGWRIGWLASLDPNVVNRCLVAHQYIATCASVPAQRLVEKLFQDPAQYKGIIQGFRQEYKNNRDLFLSEIGNAAKYFFMPTAGFYLFLPIPKGFASAQKFCRQLLEKENILTIPGDIFGSAGKKYYRLSLAASPKELVHAAKTIKKYYS